MCVSPPLGFTIKGRGEGGERPLLGAPDPPPAGGQAAGGCLWSEWGSWGPCTKECDLGVQERFRLLLQGQAERARRAGQPRRAGRAGTAAGSCLASPQEVRTCNRHACSQGQHAPRARLGNFCLAAFVSLLCKPQLLNSGSQTGLGWIKLIASA
jgi:hypothetical protein